MWIRCECRCTVPFGAPVEPDEYSQKHMSSRVVGAASRFGLPPWRASSFSCECGNDVLEVRAFDALEALEQRLGDEERPRAAVAQLIFVVRRA